MATQQSIAGRAAAAERDFVEFKSSQGHEFAKPDTMDAAECGESDRDFARILFRGLHQIFEGLVLARLQDSDRRRIPVDITEPLEIFDREVYLAHDRPHDCLWKICHADGVAVGLGGGDLVKNRCYRPRRVC